MREIEIDQTRGTEDFDAHTGSLQRLEQRCLQHAMLNDIAKRGRATTGDEAPFPWLFLTYDIVFIIPCSVCSRR
jgi:hypothetical protein